MLEEAGKIINKAFNNSFIKRITLYLHDCVREEVQSSTFRNLKQDKDNKWIFLESKKRESAIPSILDGEKLFTAFPNPLKLDGSDPFLTELMLQSSKNQKDKYLIYGYLFLVGKNTKTKRKNEFLTPLLYCACTLERNGMRVECTLQEEGLSLNTAALTSLMNLQGEEDEIENMLDGLLDVVPKLPLVEEDLNIFLTTLKSLIPDLELELDSTDNFDNNLETNIEQSSENSKILFRQKTNAWQPPSQTLPLEGGGQGGGERNNSELIAEVINYENLPEIIEETESTKQKTSIKADKVVLTNKSAIILTKRPLVTAGVLYELTQIAEKPSGTIRETSLNVINEEYLQGQGKMPSKIINDNTNENFVPITPLQLSDAQENVIKNLEDSTILSVYGPPGTGKSQTIVNLVCHLVSMGKTVLVASRMDKAADVVSDRLNSFGAPFLSLRIGRANYQKELASELENLISGKIDIDTGFENSLLVDVDDMKKLLAKIKERENKCVELVKLEEIWTKLSTEHEIKLRQIGKPEFIKGKSQLSKLDKISSMLDKIEKYSKKTDFISLILNFITQFKFKNIIQRKDIQIDEDCINRIKEELELSNLSAKIRNIENKFLKYSDINKLLNEIKSLKKKQSKLAVDILKNKRRNSLKELLRDQVKRQRLIIHTKALVNKKQNLQYRLLENEDFKPLLEAFPCWCTTSYAISNSLPLKPALFDVAIIDEASQCDIASCIPVLYRCKKAVIVGDDKQLSHLSFLEKSKEQSFLSQYEIPDKYQLMWRFRTNSMFDLANYYSMKPVLLDEHFRSAFHIIEFSNKEFYGGKIKIMTHQNGEKTLELIKVPDGKVDADMTRNQREVEAIMQRLQELINEDNERKPEKPVTIGIISPFRGQVELIKKALVQLYPTAILEKHQIEVGTAHTFQGDERDVMMLSWAIADNSFSQSVTFLQIPNLFNVAITRAKKKQIVFLSKDFKSLPQGLLKNYIEYVDNYVKVDELKTMNDTTADYYNNNFECEVAEELRREGLEVFAGQSIAGVNADLFIKDKTGKMLIVECDGVEDREKQPKNPIKKQFLMEKAGVRVERLSYREWLLSKRGCIDRIKNIFIGNE